jgi:hypothetical protein
MKNHSFFLFGHLVKAMTTMEGGVVPWEEHISKFIEYS